MTEEWNNLLHASPAAFCRYLRTVGALIGPLSCPRLKDPLLVPRSRPASKGSDIESSISGEPAPAAKVASGEGPHGPVRPTPLSTGQPRP